VTELIQYRRYILKNAWRDMRHRFAGTGLGLFWHVISPLLQILVYYYVFSHIFQKVGFDLPGVKAPFAVYLCSGMLPWVSFTEAVVRGTGAFQENAAYLKKLPIPGPVFVATAAATATLQLSVSLAILILFSVSMGLHPTWMWLLLPVICALWQFLGFGIGLLLGTLNVFFRDVFQMLVVLLQIWMWSVPIVYLEDEFRPWWVLNPPYAYLHSVREVFLYGRLPELWLWGVMVGWAVVFVAAGMLVYRALRAELRDVL
jgi:lipopolysaccharide transport system permease protein